MFIYETSTTFIMAPGFTMVFKYPMCFQVPFQFKGYVSIYFYETSINRYADQTCNHDNFRG